jgi:hypothetical protein
VTPAAVDVTANPALAVGSYTTEVVFSTPSGTEAVLLVNLEVRDLSPTLSVAPSLLNLVYKKGSANLPSGDLAVSSSGPAVDWNASASENWLILDKASGFTPDTIHVSTADSIKDFAPGSYSADVVVNSNAADGVPRTVMVNLDVLEEGAITVTTNLDEAGFTITGTESSFSGGGKTWNAVDVIAEDYTISFTHVDGYTKPYTRTFTVEPGETAEIDALYLDAPAVTHLIAGLGYGYDKTVAVYTVEGSLAFTFSPDFVRFRDNIKIEAGDMDGDGIDEIIVTNGSDTFMVYSAVGTEIAAYQFAEAVHNLEIAVDDFDNDGKAEILAGYISDNFDTTEVKSFGLAGNLIADEGLLLSQNGGQAFTFAAGDINGDGALELVMAQKTVMTAYQVFENDTSLLWSRVLAQSIPPAVAMGDINGDGVDEICFAQREENIVVTCLNGDGTDFGFEMNAFSEYKETSGASIALGDTDGDGLDEIGVGAGANRSRESLIKLFESNGQFINVIRTLNSEYGVNVSFGSFGN